LRGRRGGGPIKRLPAPIRHGQPRAEPPEHRFARPGTDAWRRCVPLEPHGPGVPGLPNGPAAPVSRSRIPAPALRGRGICRVGSAPPPHQGRVARIQHAAEEKGRVGVKGAGASRATGPPDPGISTAMSCTLAMDLFPSLLTRWPQRDTTCRPSRPCARPPARASPAFPPQPQAPGRAAGTFGSCGTGGPCPLLSPSSRAGSPAMRDLWEMRLATWQTSGMTGNANTEKRPASAGMPRTSPATAATEAAAIPTAAMIAALPISPGRGARRPCPGTARRPGRAGQKGH